MEIFTLINCLLFGFLVIKLGQTCLSRDHMNRESAAEPNSVSNSFIGKKPQNDFIEISIVSDGGILRVENSARPGAFHLKGIGKEWIDGVKELLEKYAQSSFKFSELWTEELTMIVFNYHIRCLELDEMANELLSIRHRTADAYFSSPRFLSDLVLRSHKEKEDLALAYLSPYLPHYVHLTQWLQSYREEHNPSKLFIEDKSLLAGIYLSCLAAPARTLKIPNQHIHKPSCDELVKIGYFKRVKDDDPKRGLDYLSDWQLDQILHDTAFELSTSEMTHQAQKKLAILKCKNLLDRAKETISHYSIYEVQHETLDISEAENSLKNWQYSAQTASFILQSIKQLRILEKMRRELTGENNIIISCPESHQCAFYEKNYLKKKYTWKNLPSLPAHPGCSCTYVNASRGKN